MTASVRILRARFTDPGEYLEELERDRELVERKIVRVTKIATPAGPDNVLTAVLVRAGAIVEGRPVIFEQHCGHLWQHADDVKVQDRATRLVEVLEAGLAALELEARGGYLEEVGND